ncbi:glycosyltransferase family 4 protein [Bdellovibrio sp.]|uniref:glycosyltransferase family 4 protein n=1 Tax=Bdellovibrio sp. TaxID=28201 RepID=UPI0039E724B1
MLFNTFWPFIVSLLFSAFSIPIIIKVAAIKHLMDEPDSNRKVHSQKTPTLGGVAIFAGTIFAYSAFSDYVNASDIKFMNSALILLFFAGIKDDILLLSPLKKLGVQLICALLITVFGSLRITSLWGMLGITDISPLTGIAITFLFVVALINAFNLIDGVNGLAGGLGLISALFFGSWFALTGAASLSILAFSLSGALVGFLIFNFKHGKIFMGDTGSMMIGFIISILVIKFIENNRLPGVENSSFYIKAAPAVALSAILIPLLDMTRVFFNRIIHKKSPFAADRNHIHHILLDLSLSHIHISLLLYLFSFVFIGIGLYLKELRSLSAILILVGLATLALIFAISLKKHKTKPTK